jgi:hypothetical protein
MDHQPRARAGQVQPVQGGDVTHKPGPDTELDRSGEVRPEEAHHHEGISQVEVLARCQEAWREAAREGKRPIACRYTKANSGHRIQSN